MARIAKDVITVSFCGRRDIDTETGEILERITTTLWLRPVDGPRRKRIEYRLSEAELQRIADLPRSELPADPADPHLLTCGPMTGDYVESGGGTRESHSPQSGDPIFSPARLTSLRLVAYWPYS